MVSRNYSNTLMKQLFCVFFTKLFPATAFAVFATRVALYLNDSELKTPLVTSKSALLAGDSSLLNCQKHLDVSEYFSLFNQIVHRHCYVNMICFINKYIINSCLVCRKWCTMFKCNMCIIVCSYCYILCD